jgi:hypothetical protein
MTNNSRLSRKHSKALHRPVCFSAFVPEFSWPGNPSSVPFAEEHLQTPAANLAPGSSSSSSRDDPDQQSRVKFIHMKEAGATTTTTTTTTAAACR